MIGYENKNRSSKKKDMLKFLALSDTDDNLTEKIMKQFEESDEIEISRETLLELDNNSPLIMASLVCIEFDKK